MKKLPMWCCSFFNISSLSFSWCKATHTGSQESKIDRVAKYHFSILETLSSWIGVLWNKVAILLGYKRKPVPVIKVFSSEYSQAVIDKQVELQQRNPTLNTPPNKSFATYMREDLYLSPKITVDGPSNFACARIGDKHTPFSFSHPSGFAIFGLAEAVRGESASKYMVSHFPHRLSSGLESRDLKTIATKDIERIIAGVLQELEKGYIEEFSKSSHFRVALSANLLLEGGRLFTVNIGDTRTILKRPSGELRQLTADASGEPHTKMLLAQSRANYIALEALKKLVVIQDKIQTDEGRIVSALQANACRVFEKRTKENNFCDRAEARKALYEAKSFLTDERKAICSKSSVNEFYKQLEPLESLSKMWGSLAFSVGITETTVEPGSTILCGGGIFTHVSSSCAFTLLDQITNESPTIGEHELAQRLMQAVIAKLFDEYIMDNGDDDASSVGSEEEQAVAPMALTLTSV